MLAFAFHLFENVKGVTHVDVYPDGMHDTDLFRFRPVLEARGFKKFSADTEQTLYSGQYRNGLRTLSIAVRSGQGDVVATGDDGVIIAECKGGCINTRHPGQKSQQQQRLYAAVGHHRASAKERASCCGSAGNDCNACSCGQAGSSRPINRH